MKVTSTLVLRLRTKWGLLYISKIFSKHFHFLFCNTGSKTILFLWQREPLCTGQRGFVLPHPLSSKSLLVNSELFLLCLPWSPCCGFPSGHTRHFVQTPLCHLPSLMPQPLLPLHVDMPSHPPWSPPLFMFQCHETSLDKPTRLVDKTHCNCGSSRLLSLLPVCLSSWLSPLFTKAFPEDPLHFLPLILYMVFLIKSEYPITCFFEKPRAQHIYPYSAPFLIPLSVSGEEMPLQLRHSHFHLDSHPISDLWHLPFQSISWLLVF